MKVLLVYPNVLGSLKMPLGVAYISVVLKQHGHQVDLLDTTFGITEEEVLRKGEGVGLVGVSVRTLEKRQALWISDLLKKSFNVPIIWGGPHATVRGDECLRFNCVDMVCIGEGEEAMAELADTLESGQDIWSIANIWIKKDGQVLRNAIRPLIEDLDALPYPDRGLFDRRHLCLDSGSPFSGSRGCPFGCGYCINEKLIDVYGRHGYMHYRSVDSLIDELVFAKEEYGVRYVEFADETFTLRRQWVKEFCDRYGKEVGLPFIFQTRADCVDYEVLRVIREAGCDIISFGIESGNEEFRRTVLRRRVSDEQIIKAFRMANHLKYKTYAFNMVGMPYETEENILDTIRLNKEVKTWGHNVCIFYPFPGTRLGDTCYENGWVSAEREGTLEGYYYDTILDMPQLDRLTILTYQKFWPYYLPLPQRLFPVITPIFRIFLRVGFYIQRKTKSEFLQQVINNMYVLTSATANVRQFRIFLRYLPARLRKLLIERKQQASR